MTSTTMGRGAFVDTSALVAITDTSDYFHQAAVRCWKMLLENATPLFISNYIFAETFTRTRRKLGFHAAFTLGEKLRESARLGRLTIARISQDMEEEAWQLLSTFADQELSYVDATSLVFIRHLRLGESFTFDKHFLLAGCILLPPRG